MQKRVGFVLSVFLVISLISGLGFLVDSGRSMDHQAEARIVQVQDKQGGEKGGGKDTFMIDLLRQLKQTVDDWLKSINEEIEKEDVTRFKVRFLEILRSILEWVKAEIDSWLETSEKDMRQKEGSLREVRHRVDPFSG